MLEETPSQPNNAAVDIRGAEPAQAILAVAGLAGVEHLWFCSGNDVVSFQEAAAVARERGLPAPQIRTMVHEHVALAIAMGETVVRRAPGHGGGPRRRRAAAHGRRPAQRLRRPLPGPHRDRLSPDRAGAPHDPRVLEAAALGPGRAGAPAHEVGLPAGGARRSRAGDRPRPPAGDVAARGARVPHAAQGGRDAAAARRR